MPRDNGTVKGSLAMLIICAPRQRCLQALYRSDAPIKCDINDAAMQEFIMRKVLGMNDERIADFAHLLSALRAGCPPHAGIALGLDRLIAVMLDRQSVRDVIAFPKSGRGEDLMVKSPSPMTASQLSTYHLQVRSNAE